MPSAYSLAICFQNTLELCQSDELRDATRWSIENTKLIYPGDSIELPELASDAPLVAVTPDRTFQAASRLVSTYPGVRCAVLNFASPVNPGGGVTVGAKAQEECLCRCSTLYPCLNQPLLWEGYYHPNRDAHNKISTDACIYTPSVTVFKEDAQLPRLMADYHWFGVDVITCAAPNLRGGVDISDGELYEIHVSRARRILSVAAAEGVRILVLGAFGCGAFVNDPFVVASAWHAVVGELGGWFDVIEFAIWKPPMGSINYDVFVREFR